MNKQLLVNKIKTIEGLTNEEKTKLTELLNTEKKYGLVWEDKQEDIEKRLETELPVLQEVKERAIISSAPDAPNHVLIEGDNLEALTALSYTHSGKIDVIYIDPPYNTGNKDFVYNDKFVDREDGYRHSKWLSFMNKRLRIAKGLLSDKGVIFISIDDNEQAQLKLLCDEIFGENNFVGSICRKQSSGAKNDTSENKIITTSDYILSYSNNSFFFKPYYIQNKKKYRNHDNEGFFSTRALEMQGEEDTLFARPMMGYSIYHRPNDNSIKLLFDYNVNGLPVYENPNADLIIQGYICYRPRKRNTSLGRWRWGYDTFLEKFAKNLVHFEKGRVFIKERDKSNIPKYPETIWLDYLNTQGTNELKKIMGEKTFSFPKPTNLIKQIIKITNSSTILDFFAGSGTTLHATMQLNNEDGGKRQCILVTNNENGICENVTYERNKRVINGYTTPKGENIAGLKENTLRYYKTSLLPREKTTANMRRLMLLATDMLCIRNNVYAPAPLAGKYLNDNIARYFNDGKRQLLVVYREEAIKALVKIILKSPRTENRIKTYVFSPNSYAFDEDFYDVADRVELCALPDAIYNAYRHVLPKPKKQNAETNENNETSAEQ